VRIMFSRIIPLEEEPRQHVLWVMAERFGATCTAHMGDDVTHLVTNTQHTLKVSRSKKDGWKNVENEPSRKAQVLYFTCAA